MNVVYERSGGFGGMMQSLRIEAGKMLARDKGKTLAPRDLTPDEAAQFSTLLDQAAAADPPIDNFGAHQASDSYAVMLSFDEEPEPRVSLSTLTLPVMGAGEAWDELLGWLDRQLTAELRKYQPPGAKQILTADELLGEES